MPRVTIRDRTTPSRLRSSTAPRRKPVPRRLRLSRRAIGGLRWWTRNLRMLAAGLAIVTAISGGIFLYASGAGSRLVAGLSDAVNGAVSGAGFRVEEVAVLGRERTDPAAILAALGVSRGEPILGFDPEAARAALVALPWIRDAEVQRRLPDAIHVRLVERRPLALWQNGGRYSVIDDEGEVLMEDADEAWFALPLVVGPGAPQAALAHLVLLGQSPAVAQRTEASVRVGSRRWDLHLDNGIVVQLPERGEAEAIARLGGFLTDGQLDQYDVIRVDLRLEDRMVIETSPLTSGQRPRQGENT